MLGGNQDGSDESQTLYDAVGEISGTRGRKLLYYRKDQEAQCRKAPDPTGTGAPRPLFLFLRLTGATESFVPAFLCIWLDSLACAITHPFARGGKWHSPHPATALPDLHL